MTHFENDLEQCLQSLRSGGVILYPTDTIWGLGCDATNAEAVQKLMDIKGKPPRKGLIVLVGSEREVLQYVAAPDLALFDYLATVQKPTTVIYEHGLNVADEVLNEDGSIAIRIVQEDFCRHLLKRFKKPVVSTSANIHGEASPQHFGDISNDVKEGVDYVVAYRQDEQLPAVSSAIIKWRDGAVQVIRP